MIIISRAEARTKGLKQYYTGKPCKHGHVAVRQVVNSTCFDCMKIMCSNQYKKNPESFKARAKKNKAAMKTDPIKHAAYKKQAREWQSQKIKNNPEYHAMHKERRARQMRERKKSDPVFAATEAGRNMVSRLIRDLDIYKNQKSWDMLDYSKEQFKAHIESQFEAGMSWGNHGEWHLDHIKSVKKFIKEGVTDPMVINALSNLQPLWAIDNLAKGWK